MIEITLKVDNMVRIRKSDLPAKGIDLLKAKLTFKNPLYGRKVRFNKPLKDVQPTLKSWQENDDELLISRGFMKEVIRICHLNGYLPKIVFQVRRFDPIFYLPGTPQSNPGMSADQGEALEVLLAEPFVILDGFPGSGRRVVAIKAACRRNVPVLTVVQSIRDLYLWKEAVVKHAGMLDDQIGLVGDGKKEIGRGFTVAVDRSFMNHLDDLEPLTGTLMIDRCNTANLNLLYKTLCFSCPYMLGLGTGARQDGLTRLMEALIGPRVYRLQDPEEDRRGLRLQIKETGYRPSLPEDGLDWRDLVADLAEDPGRNQVLAGEVLMAAARRGARCLLVSERISQIQEVLELVREASGPPGAVWSHRLSAVQEAEIRRKWENRGLRILGCSFKSVPRLEGLPPAEHLFILYPVRYNDYLARLLIRSVRPEGVVHDFKDPAPAMLQGSFRRRMRMYRSLQIH